MEHAGICAIHATQQHGYWHRHLADSATQAAKTTIIIGCTWLCTPDSINLKRKQRLLSSLKCQTNTVHKLRFLGNESQIVLDEYDFTRIIHSWSSMCIIMKTKTHVHECHVSERQDIIIIIMKTIKDEDSCGCASRNWKTRHHHHHHHHHEDKGNTHVHAHHVTERQDWPPAYRLSSPFAVTNINQLQATQVLDTMIWKEIQKYWKICQFFRCVSPLLCNQHRY